MKTLHIYEGGECAHVHVDEFENELDIGVAIDFTDEEASDINDAIMRYRWLQNLLKEKLGQVIEHRVAVGEDSVLVITKAKLESLSYYSYQDPDRTKPGGRWKQRIGGRWYVTECHKEPNTEIPNRVRIVNTPVRIEG